MEPSHTLRLMLSRVRIILLEEDASLVTFWWAAWLAYQLCHREHSVMMSVTDFMGGEYDTVMETRMMAF